MFTFHFDTGEAAMGVTYAEITLINVVDKALARRGIIREDEIRKITLSALVDSGANTLVINKRIQDALGLTADGKKNVRTADGSIHFVPTVLSVEVRFQDRFTSCEAFVSENGPDCLLGAIPIEGLDVVIDLNNQKLIPNPEHPDGPLYLMM
ncbi:MAG: retropepsin-like domain-containing protein [Planctomycetaceae bacterium]|jgi:clan AA aspartic protease|nr:retropepsin-like domain-containing protein [Planctomycetaceae bacterium]